MADIDLREAATEALALVGADPRAALARADEVVASIPRQRRSAEQREALSMAHRAAGLALSELPDMVGAESRLRASVRAARSARHQQRAAEAAMSLAFVLLQRGRAVEALDTLDRALLLVDGLPEARVRAQRALVLHKGLGRSAEALVEFDRAITELGEAHDGLDEAKALVNRGHLYAYRGDLDLAEADLRRSVELCQGLGLTHRAAETLADLAWLLGIAGRTVESLALMDQAAALLPSDDPVAWLDRADVLGRAGLVHEAQSIVERAVQWLDRHPTGWDGLRAEAELSLAQSLLQTGDPTAALERSQLARALFARQRRGPWEVLASYIEHLAGEAGGLPAPENAEPTEAVVERLEAHGWRSQALHLRVTAAAGALRRGDEAAARTLVGDPRPDPGARLEMRSRTAQLLAIGALLDDDVPAFRAHLARAWGLGERLRSLVGATELRAAGSAAQVGVVRLGLDQALHDRSAVQVLAWAERGRAATLRFPPAAPPDEAGLAAALGRVRLAARAAESAALEGRRDDVALAARARGEREVRRRSRQASGRRPAAGRATAADVRAHAAGAVFVELVVAGEGRLVAVVVGPRRTRLLDVARAADARSAAAALDFTLRRLIAGAAPGQEMLPRVRAAAAELDRLLLGPLRAFLGADAVVVAPPPGLWGVPWSLLPSLAGRPVVVAASATSWVRARTRALPARPRTLAVAGPGLVESVPEVDEVARAHPGADVLVGADASVERVTLALRRCDVAHLAVHGTLRKDNPLFSTLELADGPLTGYDLERVSPMPHTMVLPACHSASAAAVAGDEMLGLASTLLGAGAASVVSTVAPLPDAAAVPLMAALHRGLAGGLPPAEALARAQGAVNPGDAPSVAAAAVLVCVGS